MKRILPALLLLALIPLLAACGGSSSDETTPQLTVVGGPAEKVYTLDDLRDLPVSTVEVDGAVYSGVILADLLQDAGIEVDDLSSVNAVASDDFSATYDPDIFSRSNTIVAYELDGGRLLEEERPFRMVLPDQPGRLNVRMLVRLEAGS
jgi:hypothetical protein